MKAKKSPQAPFHVCSSQLWKKIGDFFHLKKKVNFKTEYSFGQNIVHKMTKIYHPKKQIKTNKQTNKQKH
jgi:hypothetical protein